MKQFLNVEIIEIFWWFTVHGNGVVVFKLEGRGDLDMISKAELVFDGNLTDGLHIVILTQDEGKLTHSFFKYEGITINSEGGACWRFLEVNVKMNRNINLFFLMAKK